MYVQREGTCFGYNEIENFLREDVGERRSGPLLPWKWHCCCKTINRGGSAMCIHAIINLSTSKDENESNNYVAH